MDKFTFYIDQKVMDWERKTYHIEADSVEDALEEAKKIYNEESDAECTDVISVGDIVNMEPAQNNGSATRQLFSEDLAVPILENA